jgi:hypothetical protein
MINCPAKENSQISLVASPVTQTELTAIKTELIKGKFSSGVQKGSANSAVPQTIIAEKVARKKAVLF